VPRLRDAFARVNLGLAVKRQMVAIFGDEHMSDEAGAWLAAFDRRRGHGRLDLRVAALADDPTLNVPHDAE
jgi:hypothetical protein